MGAVSLSGDIVVEGCAGREPDGRGIGLCLPLYVTCADCLGAVMLRIELRVYIGYSGEKSTNRSCSRIHALYVVGLRGCSTARDQAVALLLRSDDCVRNACHVFTIWTTVKW